MHAHINIWKLSDAGQSSGDTISRAIAAHLRGQPGFHSYTLIRTGEQEVTAVTVFETPAMLHDALESLPAEVRENIRRTTTGSPEHRVGDVIHHEHIRE